MGTTDWALLDRNAQSVLKNYVIYVSIEITICTVTLRHYHIKSNQQGKRKRFLEAQVAFLFRIVETA